jgi:hypothetical protein
MSCTVSMHQWYDYDSSLSAFASCVLGHVRIKVVLEVLMERCKYNVVFRLADSIQYRSRREPLFESGRVSA